MFHLCRNQVVGFYLQHVWKPPVDEWHFASKNQLPGLSVSGTLNKNFQSNYFLLFNSFKYFGKGISSNRLIGIFKNTCKKAMPWNTKDPNTKTKMLILKFCFPTIYLSLNSH